MEEDPHYLFRVRASVREVWWVSVEVRAGRMGHADKGLRLPSLMGELRVLTGFESEGDMIKMMLQEVLKGFESRWGERAWDEGEVPHISTHQLSA